MSNNQHNEKEFVHSEYEQMAGQIAKDHVVLVSHYGELSQNIISSLEATVEEKLTSFEIPKGPFKKIFFISVETLQNLIIHGHKNAAGEQHNFFIMSKNDQDVNILSANLVSNAAVEILQKQIDVINSFEDEKALKAYYLEHLANNELSEKGGAGLGFITICIKSGNKLKIDFKQINDQFSLFYLTSCVNFNSPVS